MPLRRGLLGLVAVLLLLGAFTGGVYVDQNFPEYVPSLTFNRGQIDRSKTDQALRVIEAHYYDAHVDHAKLADGSVRGMVQSLGDPYSQYLTPEEFRRQQDVYAGRHTGMIGIYVNLRDGYPVIGGILPNSPALRAGLRSGDVILRVDGTDVGNLTSDRTSALIRGPVGTMVTLHVRRDGTELDVPVTRADFHSPTVASARLAGDILYLRVYEFGDATQREFDEQLRAGLSGTKGVVLDLRDNGGGLVTAATAMISRFVDSGEAIEQRGRNGGVAQTSVDGDHPAADLPVIVLVNQNTASASEIVAGSLQARGRARLLGTKTFGKGSVQVDYRLDDGSYLHLTIAHWYLPDGRSIDKQGLNPDVVVPQPDQQLRFDVVQPGAGFASDAQLTRAVGLLNGQ